MKQTLAKYGSLGTSGPTLWSRLLLPVGELRDIRFNITLHTFHVIYFHEHRRMGSSGGFEEQSQTVNELMCSIDHMAENGSRNMLEAINK